MALTKTEKAKLALQSRDPSLSPRERQLLVLANGTRTRKALAALMEKSIDDTIDRLIAAEFLVETNAAALRVASPPSRSVPTRPAVQQQPQTLSRRSLAATKMYTMDMLQLLRDMEASGMAVSLHTSESEAAFMANVFLAVRLISVKSGPSFALRVLAKLQEIVPQPYVAGVDGLMAELMDTSEAM